MMGNSLQVLHEAEFQVDLRVAGDDHTLGWFVGWLQSSCEKEADKSEASAAAVQ
jgi:hypothetical protein